MTSESFMTDLPPVKEAEVTIPGHSMLEPVDYSEFAIYESNLLTEYQQSWEEGLDIGDYRDVFLAVARLPKSAFKEKLGGVLFDVVSQARQRKDYEFTEPSDLASIQALRKPYAYRKTGALSRESRICGAWLGRISGCMLGKPVEGIHTEELIPFLQETGNYPMHRYIYRSDLNEERLRKYRYDFAAKAYADEVDGMPVDDDTNYMVLYQEIIGRYGRDFTPEDVSRAWVAYQDKSAYCTAELLAYGNFTSGILPPDSASHRNPFREWVGAQIRGDYFGYINPGEPELAAEMAWRDASVSHVKNGIYGEMFVSAMLAVAAETNCAEDIIRGGLAQIPVTSRLYGEVQSVVEWYKNGVPREECFRAIHQKYDEHMWHTWCHVLPNAMIVAASLLYGEGDFARSICMAVETGFDTDCNGATVGSILGMANGIESIPAYWTTPFRDTLHTSIHGIGTVQIRDRVEMTLEHMKSVR